MRIGFEAKRIYQNKTGLGNFARTLLDALSTIAVENSYHLFAPNKTNLFDAQAYKNIEAHFPKTTFHKTLKWYWRSSGMLQDIHQEKLDIFHGLNFELPYGLEKLKLKKVVTVHDLIFERFPHHFKKIDVWIHRKKTRHACAIADAICVMSKQTKDDLVHYYKIDAQKIHVTYLSIQETFYQKHSKQELQIIRKKYRLPETYFLYVGSIIERKGLLKICEALLIVNANIPLVVIGKGNNEYCTKVKLFVEQNHLQAHVIFLSEQQVAQDINFINSKDFPAIYQNAKALIYPSIFEGFGMPVLEGLASGIATITSNVSALTEVGGNGAIYINPVDAKDISNAMQLVIDNDIIVQEKIALGKLHAQKFSKQNLVERMMKVYNFILNR
jgi:glycosyltransferase involved in cell wall biosynthesis